MLLIPSRSAHFTLEHSFEAYVLIVSCFSEHSMIVLIAIGELLVMHLILCWPRTAKLYYFLSCWFRNAYLLLRTLFIHDKKIRM